MGNLPREYNLVALLQQLEKQFADMTIVETGTIRQLGRKYEIGDGHSTYHITKRISNSKVTYRFYSIDLNIRIARDYLASKHLLKFVNLIQKDSIEFLRDFNYPIHFAYLDSANHAEHIYNEFNLVLPKMVKGGYILIDDAIPLSKEVVKIHKVLPYLSKNKFNYYLYNNQCVIKL